MKILIITNHFWPESFRINDLATSLHALGYEVTVLTGIPNYPEGRFFPGYGIFKNRVGDYRGVKVIRVPMVPRGNARTIRLAINYITFALSSCLLAPFLCRDKYDLIFVFETSPVTVGLPALVMKRLRSVPVMFWVQDLWPESLSATGAIRNRKILSIIDNLVRFIYNGSDRILVQSKAFIDSVCEHGVPLEKILFFPNSAEDFYKPVYIEPDAVELKLMPSGFIVMFAGNIGAAQDFPTILAAAERLRYREDIHFVILGDGRMRNWVEAEVRIRSLEKTVHLLGRYPVESMPRFFSVADSLLVTLRREPIFSLTIPSKLQSYMACGKPIICALDGEGAKIVEMAGAGVTCPAEDSEALANSILTMNKLSEKDRCAMGESGRRYFNNNFESSMLVNKLNDWIKHLVITSEIKEESK